MLFRSLEVSGAKKPHYQLLKSKLAPLLGDMRLRLFIPPILFRIIRCSNDDIKALSKFFSMKSLLQTREGEPPPPPPLLRSQVVQFNILASELMTTSPWNPPPIEELERIESTLYFSTHNAPTMMDLWRLWPRYSVDGYSLKYPQISPDVPVLMMNGDLDPQTPFWMAQRAFSHYKSSSSKISPKSFLALISGAPHGTPFFSPVTNSSIPCGLSLMSSFATSSGQSLDLSCLSHLEPFDWMGKSEMMKRLSSYFLGTPDMWQL